MAQSNRGQKLTQAISESVGADKLQSLFADKAPEPAKVKKTRKKPVVPGAPHKRAAYDQGKRNAELEAGKQVAQSTQVGDQLTRMAADLVQRHTREIMAAKQRHPDNQAIQELEPISMEEARRQVAGNNSSTGE